MMDQPPANIAGVWDGVTTNAGVATFTGCTGDLAPFSGLTVAAVQALSPKCVTQDLFVVTQFEDVFTYQGQSFNRDDGSSYTQAGGGTLNGDSLSGSVDTIHSSGVIGDDLYTGVVTSSTTLTVQEYRATVTGALNGSCNIDPDLETQITISQLASAADGAFKSRGPSTAVIAASAVQ